MPRSIKNDYGITLRTMIQATYQFFPNRIEYKNRDVISRITIKEIKEYVGNKSRRKFVIESTSYPQYYPYYTKKDSRGRTRSRQKTYKHKYDVILQMDELSVDSDRIKLRTGADAKWDFSEAGRSKKDRRGRVKEGTNIKRGLNGDFFFRLSAVYKHYGILFGRNWANGLPTQTNPQFVPFLDKHALHVVEVLINRGIIQ